MNLLNNIIFSMFFLNIFSLHLAYQQQLDCPNSNKMNIAVIGVGAGGLTALRHIRENIPDANVVGFEIGKEVGGTWLYNEKVGEDEDGIPLRSSMYKNLRTNLPKNVMAFPDFPIPHNYKSFMDHNEFSSYLLNYAKHFDLYKYIKFRHNVSLVKHVKETDKWKITYKNLITQVNCSEIFDYIFVANGHYTEYIIPEYKGQHLFKGGQIHSHDYRYPELYKNRTVLIVGAGPSGIDISMDIARHSRKLFLSHHKEKPFSSPFPSTYIQKPDIVEFTENSVIFKDGSVEEIDDIVYCTGYKYYCPFLDSSCNINVTQKYIYPLYRHLVNIEHPSMFFIGIPQMCCIIPMMDMQVRYAVAAITGKFKFPSKEKMYEYIEYEYEMKKKISFTLKHSHTLGKFEYIYNVEMGEESGIKPLPPVFCAIRQNILQTRSNLYTYRNYHYRILDDNHFIRFYDKDTEKSTIFDSSECLKITKQEEKSTRENVVNFVRNQFDDSKET